MLAPRSNLLYNSPHMKTLLTILAVFLTISMVYASARAPSKKADIFTFETSAAWQKADLRLRTAWHEAMQRDKKNTKFECILKTRDEMTADQKAIIKSAGFNYRSLIGNIVTGSFEARNLPAIAELKFVEAIELAMPMGIK